MFLHTQIAPVEGVKLTRGTEVLPVAFYLNQMLNWNRQAYVMQISPKNSGRNDSAAVRPDVLVSQSALLRQGHSVPGGRIRPSQDR